MPSALHRMSFLKADLKAIILRQWETHQPTSFYFYLHLGLFAGLLLLAMLTAYWNSQAFSVAYRYDQACENRLKQFCSIKIHLPSPVPQGSILFLQLNGFAQSFRRMMNSWSADQLAGVAVDMASEGQRCLPDVTNQQMEKYWAVDGSKLEGAELSRPCGLMSKYYPQDSFEFFGPDEARVRLGRSGIAWDGLQGHKFKSTDKSREWANVESETFINWMQPNTWHNAYKAWGRFEQPLAPGIYTVRIYNGTLSSPDLNPQLFAGQKLFGVAVLGSLGGANPVLPATMIVLCITSFLMMLIFLYLSKTEAMLFQLEQEEAEEADRRDRQATAEPEAREEKPAPPKPVGDPASDSSARPASSGLAEPLLAGESRGESSES